MAETKVIETTTSVSVIGDVISIRAYYDTSEVDAATLEAFISDSVQVREGVTLIEGELAIIMTDGLYPSEIDFEINADGELIVTADDSANYSIDSSGDLIYTEL
jgi:hypothetical protein